MELKVSDLGKEIGNPDVAVRCFNALAANLISGNSVQITGFGRFAVIPTAAKSGVNPKTGARIPIAASWKVKFTPASKLKAAVKGK